MLAGKWTLEYSPMFVAAEFASRIFSPYDLNPMGINPLRKLLAETVDFAALTTSPIKLFITATNVRTGSGHVFRNAEITPDVLLASGCLPTMFQPVEIGGEGALWANMRVHRIATDRVTELDSTSNMITEWRFLCGLRDEGRRTAQLFLDAHADDLGKRSTLDLDAMLQTL